MDEDQIPELAQLMPTGEHLEHPRVRYRQGRRIVLERTDGVPLAFSHDGARALSGGQDNTVRVWNLPLR